jgi:hypothetical protein
MSQKSNKEDDGTGSSENVVAICMPKPDWQTFTDIDDQFNAVFNIDQIKIRKQMNKNEDDFVIGLVANIVKHIDQDFQVHFKAEKDRVSKLINEIIQVIKLDYRVPASFYQNMQKNLAIKIPDIKTCSYLYLSDLNYLDQYKSLKTLTSSSSSDIVSFTEKKVHDLIIRIGHRLESETRLAMIDYFNGANQKFDFDFQQEYLGKLFIYRPASNQKKSLYENITFSGTKINIRCNASEGDYHTNTSINRREAYDIDSPKDYRFTPPRNIIGKKYLLFQETESDKDFFKRIEAYLRQETIKFNVTFNGKNITLKQSKVLLETLKHQVEHTVSIKK